MKYSELISKLEYWKRISEEDDPEVVINDEPYSYEITNIQPVIGIENNRAIGIIFEN
jgi:hypothetical protein